MKAMLESIVRRFFRAQRDGALRTELAAFNASPDDESESYAWRQVMAASQWTESGGDS